MKLPKTKVCTKCGKRKKLEAYYAHQGGRYGKGSRCKACRAPGLAASRAAYYAKNKARLRARMAEYYAANREKALVASRRRYAENGEEARAAMRAYYIAHREKRLVAMRKWQQDNREWRKFTASIYRDLRGGL